MLKAPPLSECPNAVPFPRSAAPSSCASSPRPCPEGFHPMLVSGLG